MKAIAKELSFNIGGHLLHTTFWENMAPPGKGGGGQPGGAVADMINIRDSAALNGSKKNSLPQRRALKVQDGQR